MDEPIVPTEYKAEESWVGLGFTPPNGRKPERSGFIDPSVLAPRARPHAARNRVQRCLDWLRTIFAQGGV